MDAKDVGLILNLAALLTFLGEIMKFARITSRADQMGGQPCIRGLRIPVATVVAMVMDGMTDEEILEAYPDLELEDIQEALNFSFETV